MTSARPLVFRFRDARPNRIRFLGSVRMPKDGGDGMRKIVPALLLAVVAVACSRTPKRPPAPKEDTDALVKGNNTFAFDLYGKLREREGNLFFSPYSISTALAMTYAGARGDTAKEMADTLHLTLDESRLHRAFAALRYDLLGGGKKRGYQLSVANALWGQKGYDFLTDFVKLTKDNYGTGLREVDFVRAAEAARKTINDWVEKETKDRIKELLAQGTVGPDTRLVLTNAIYFKGDWASQFKKDATRNQPFHLSADKSTQVPMMSQKGKFGYLETDTFQALEMPYVGKDLSMVVLLPKKVDGLGALEKDLSADRLAGWLGRLREREVQVILPRFRTTSEFALNDVLSELGMKKAFTSAADFSGLSGRTDLFISAVVHKAFVDVNEEGTEAAAATAVVSARKGEVGGVRFRADHPFVFLIRDRRSDSVLFLGRLAQP